MWIVFLLFVVQSAFANNRYPNPGSLAQNVRKAILHAGGPAALANRTWKEMRFLRYLPKVEKGGMPKFKNALHKKGTLQIPLGNLLRDVSLLAYTNGDAYPFLLEFHRESKETFLEPVAERIIARWALRFGEVEKLAQFMQAEGISRTALYKDNTLLHYSDIRSNEMFWEDVTNLAGEMYGDRWAAARQRNTPEELEDKVVKILPDVFPVDTEHTVSWLKPIVKGRGPLAQSAADLSPAATRAWLNQDAENTLILSVDDMKKYAQTLLLDDDLKAITQDGTFLSSPKSELINNYFQMHGEAASTLCEQYVLLLSDIRDFLRVNERFLLSFAQEDSHVLNAKEYQVTYKAVQTLQHSVASFKHTYFKQAVPPSLQMAEKVLNKVVPFWEAGVIFGQ